MSAAADDAVVDLDALKREHDAAFEAVVHAQPLADKVNALRDRIKEIEGDDYDFIQILFAGTFGAGDDNG